MLHTIKQKAKAISNDRKTPFGLRILCGAVSSGGIKPNALERKFIVSNARQIEEGQGIK